jgi:thiosulfate/3-mercaptopyruvate sulfurtransferase
MSSRSPIAVLVCLAVAGGGYCAAEDGLLGNAQFSIVTPEWVAAHADDKDLRILDVRPDVHAYFAGHVPNAVHVADACLRGPANGLPVQFLPPESMAELLARAGITNDCRVVVYSDGEHVLGATMMAYCLERLGHSNIMIMDGGYAAYAASQKPTQSYPRYEPGRFAPHFERSIFVTLDEVKTLKDQPGVTLIDSRPPPVYRGEVKTWMRSGHIPGAVNIDWHTLMETENLHKFRSREEIARIFEQQGVTRDQDIIVSCGTGREATLEYLYLKHVLGLPKVRVYEGSWTEWCSHPELEIATGERPGGKARKAE